MLGLQADPRLGRSMRLGIIIAVLVAAAVGLGTYYWWVGREIADIQSRLVTEAELAEPEDPDTTSGIKLAPIQCERVFDLRENDLAHGLRGGEIDSLWAHCERIADIASGIDKIEKKGAQ
jgi:hypothetical protein